jgi:phenylalanyl-tRNA synthetase beta chain
MFISFRWLSRHVDLAGVSARDLARDLTLQTAEVEGVQPFAPALADVVVGHVLSREKHPDADKLGICKVDLGPLNEDGEPYQIVCGAPNVGPGQLVAVARIGTHLPVQDGEPGETFKIKKSKIRGVESCGMICSERELGLGDEHDGIWVLPYASEGHADLIGLPVADALGSIDGHYDWIIEIDNKSLTHRPDLWGHRGIAGEVAAIRGIELKPIATELPAFGDAEPVSVKVETPGCSRYLGIAIDGLRNGKSPEWMRHLLLATGQRPIDLFVDISNFVMLDMAQPNHLFDRGTLGAEGILVRDAKAGETIQTLDGEERKLTPDDLLITSGGCGVALAGIMGGEGSKVREGTTSLLLELATFDPIRVRKTSARLGLRSDSSARFEKSLDPTLPMKAAAHMLSLLLELQPDLVLPAPPAEDGSWSDPACQVDLRPARARAVLGLDEGQLSNERIESMLQSLGFGVAVVGDHFTIDVPSARSTKDIGIEEDLIEEVGRVFRYDRIPERRLVAELAPVARDERRYLVRKIADRLAGGAEFHETMSYSFLAESLTANLGIADAPCVRVKNPAAEGLERIRRGVAPSLIGLVRGNLRRVAGDGGDLRLFEIGKGYLPELASGDALEPKEIHEAALLLARPGATSGDPADFAASALFRLKGVVGDLLVHLERALPDRDGASGLVWACPDEDSAFEPFCHPGKTMVARAAGSDMILALVSELEPGVAAALGLDGDEICDVAFATVSIDALVAAPKQALVHRPLPRFPGVKVDVALALDEATAASDVERALVQSGKGLVKDLELFDLYMGPNVGEGKKSLAWHVLLQSDQKTLGEKDMNKFLKRVEGAAGRLGGELRRE